MADAAPDVEFVEADAAHLRQIAQIRWQLSDAHERAAHTGIEQFADVLSAWYGSHRATHTGVVGVTSAGNVVAFGFLAVVPRVPSPSAVSRRSADVQAVFVAPELRNRGLGGALVAELLSLARQTGVEHVTVHANQRAATLYERSGFVHDRDMLTHHG